MNTKYLKPPPSSNGLLKKVRIPRRLRRSQIPFVLLCLGLIAFTVIYSTVYLKDDYFTSEEFMANLSKYTYNSNKIVIFPKDCRLRNEQLGDYYINTLHHELLANDVVFKSHISNKLKKVSYKPTSMEIFKTSEKSKCSASLIPFKVSRAYNMNTDLYKILVRFAHEDSEYYKEMHPFFPDLASQLRTRTIEKYWFQMIGSSVWLEQYGVHLMISRIFYTKTGDKVKPVMSLSYVQVYDRDWNELENVELIVPNDDDTNGAPEYKSVSYPNFLPVPVYHNVAQQKGRFYGAEDPRIILIRNDKGYEEPIIIFNSHNRKISQVKNFKDIWSTVRLDMYRSMFMGWLWRTQRGKSNIDEVMDQSHLQDVYVKVKELKLPSDFTLRKKEKNWTPFIDYEYRQNNGYDSDLKLIYQFQDLKILSCSLNPTITECIWEYQQNEENPPAIKRLRGGTELISINELLDNSNYNELNKFKQILIRDNKQLWVGFARVVLKNCGCGFKMYRPNLVVLLKDSEGYSFSAISSFMDLDVPIIPWYDDGMICSGKNLLVPNGISSWNFAKDKSGKPNDYLTLTLSRSDATVDILFAKGILRKILTESLLPSPLVKNENNVKCAIKSSKEFCKVYAEHAQSDYNMQMNSLASDLLEHMNHVATAAAARNSQQTGL